MHLHISTALLFTLLTGGFCLQCYTCFDQQGCKENRRCDSEESRCGNSRSTEYTAGTQKVDKEIGCFEPQECKSWSMTILGYRMEDSIHCCDTDLCNQTPAPELKSELNGKQCFTCDWDGCFHRLKCRGNEDHCFTVYGTSEAIMKGCASDAACETSRMEIISHDANVTCCEGNLCNAAQGVFQSVLFLCCSLIFCFLLHRI